MQNECGSLASCLCPWKVLDDCNSFQLFRRVIGVNLAQPRRINILLKDTISPFAYSGNEVKVIPNLFLIGCSYRAK